MLSWIDFFDSYIGLISKFMNATLFIYQSYRLSVNSLMLVTGAFGVLYDPITGDLETIIQELIWLVVRGPPAIIARCGPF